MEFKWSVNKVTVAEDNLVVKVHLMVTGTDGDNSASAAYSRELVRGDTFTEFAQLTEQQVLDWCFAPEVTTWLDMDNVEQSSTRLVKDDGESMSVDLDQGETSMSQENPDPYLWPAFNIEFERQLAQAAAEPKLPWVTQDELTTSEI